MNAAETDDIGVDAEALLAASSAELSVAKILVAVAASLSLSASLLMVVCFVKFQESRRCGRRVLFCLHLCDAGSALAWLLTLRLPMGQSSHGTSGLCYVQSYLLVFFQLASYLWTACFAFHLFQILGRRSKYPELYEQRYHIITWGISASAVIQLGIQQLSGSSLLGESGRPWCWFRSWSDFEWSRGGFYVQLLVFYIPVMAIFVHNLVTYIALLYRLNDVLSTSMEDRVWRRMMAYSWVFFLSLVWGIFGFFYQATAEDHELSSTMLYVMSFFTPLQGAMNALAYGFNGKLKKRLQDITTRLLLKR